MRSVLNNHSTNTQWYLWWSQVRSILKCISLCPMLKVWNRLLRFSLEAENKKYTSRQLKNNAQSTVTKNWKEFKKIIWSPPCCWWLVCYSGHVKLLIKIYFPFWILTHFICININWLTFTAATWKIFEQ